MHTIHKTATVINFPYERRFAVRVEAEWDGPGWYVLSHNREHGWLHGGFDAALRDARIVADSYGVCVVSSAGVWRS
jgi:hypothetical protein